jgi:hypothetical protein
MPLPTAPHAETHDWTSRVGVVIDKGRTRLRFSLAASLTCLRLRLSNVVALDSLFNVNAQLFSLLLDLAPLLSLVLPLGSSLRTVPLQAMAL